MKVNPNEPNELDMVAREGQPIDFEIYLDDELLHKRQLLEEAT